MEVESSLEGDIRVLLRALPARWDIEALIIWLEETHRRDIQAVRTDIKALTERVNAGEGLVSALEQRVEAIERAQIIHQVDTAVELQLNMEVLEDRSRRNNLRLRGLPEATGIEDPQTIVSAIFQEVLKSPPDKG